MAYAGSMHITGVRKWKVASKSTADSDSSHINIFFESFFNGKLASAITI
jgi:hypothetical protein